MDKAKKKNGIKNLFSKTVVLLCVGLAGLLVWPGMSHSATGKVKTRVEIDRGTLPADRVQTAIVKVTLEAAAPLERGRRPKV
jgi:hypothetical protein